MLQTDLYLGSFLVVVGFALSLLNLRKIIKETRTKFSTVLLSENIVLTSIGIAFILRAVYDLKPFDSETVEMELRSAEMTNNEKEMDCSFGTVLMSYGPLVVSMVNSFLSLVIDNYMHYRMIADTKKEEEESEVRSVNEELRSSQNVVKKFVTYWNRNFTFFAVASQWIVPTVIALAMYPIDIKERNLLMDHSRTISDSCVAAIDMQNQNCSSSYNANSTFELRHNIPGMNYFEAYENEQSNISDKILNTVISNVYNIISDFKNRSHTTDFSSQLLREPKDYSRCMKICFMDNKNLIIYMFGMAVISYFVPITISMVILTKIHVMQLKRPNVKTYVSRELLYNMLFWTPVVFDTFLSITMCTYSMSGMRTSIFNIIANVYQAVKNFMNSKYFKDNAVIPV